MIHTTQEHEAVTNAAMYTSSRIAQIAAQVKPRKCSPDLGEYMESGGYETDDEDGVRYLFECLADPDNRASLLPLVQLMHAANRTSEHLHDQALKALGSVLLTLSEKFMVELAESELLRQ